MDSYIIVREISVLELEKVVNSKLANGYDPIGGVTYNGTVYLQAMILQPEEK